MEKVKNIITNILGLIVWYFMIIEIISEKDISLIILLLFIGGLLFRSNNRTIKSIFDKWANKIIG